MNKLFILLASIWFSPFLNGTLLAQAPDWLWARSAGGADSDWGNSVAVDSYGNTYVTGSFNSSPLMFGSYTLTNAGGDDIFLAKYDASGTVLWAKSAGGAGSEGGTSVAVDAYGNTYIAGYFSSDTVIFESDTLTNEGWFDIFIAKYDANGTVLWAKSAVGTGIDICSSVVLDASGNAYATGYFISPTLTFGTLTLTNANGLYEDIFLVKYDLNGNVLWAKSAGGTNTDGGQSVAVDAYGNSFLTGYFASPTITFGSYTLTNAGDFDLFLVKYNPNGNVLWAKSAGGAGSDGGTSVAVDAYGNSFLTGDFASSTITFGSYTLTNAGIIDIFLVKSDANGTVLWGKSAGGTSIDGGNSVAVDSYGNTYVTGHFDSPILTIGSYTLTNAGSDDVFLAKYDANGTDLWAKSAGGTSQDNGMSVAVDSSGNAYVTGDFSSDTIIFESDTLTNAGWNDIFLAKMESISNVGYNEPTSTYDISVYPNPAAGKISIKTTGIAYNINLFILNLSGQQILQQEITEAITTINVSGLKSGVYLIKVIGANDIQVSKFVKQ